LLGYSDKELWNLTPKYFASQLEVHYDLLSQQWGGKSTRNSNGKKQVKPVVKGYIDQIPGWG
jgi:hypothetical protein